MTAIQIYITGGAHAGRRLAFTDSPVSFGRQAGNTVIIDVPQASRQQGELRFEGGSWKLQNLSSHGTKVNGRTVRKRPAELREGDVVGVGSTSLFRVSLKAPVAEAAQAGAVGEPGQAQSFDPFADESDEQAKPKSGMSRKAKIYLGVGLYSALLLVIFAVVLPALRGGGDGARERLAVGDLTKDDIRQQVDRPVAFLREDPREAERFLNEARDAYNNIRQGEIFVYRAYADFRKHLAHAHRHTLADPVDAVQYLDVRNRVVDNLWERYEDALLAKKTGNYAKAVAEFDALLRLYTDTESMVYKNAAHHRADAKREMGG